MAQFLSCVIVHVVFSTKNRERLIPADIDERLHAFLGGICREHGCTLIAAGGVEDHRHLLIMLGRTITLAAIVMHVKKASSLWMKEFVPAFAWQGGYGVFSVSMSNVDDVKSYIADQRQHHSRMSFEDEFRALLRKHGLTWDEAYVWD